MLVFMTKLLLVVGAKATAVGREEAATTTNIDCPIQCQCSHLNGRPTSDCDRRGLTSVPARFPSSTMSLVLTGNNLGDMTESRLFQRRGVDNVVWLLLRNSSIEAVGEQTFNGLANLQKLDLSRNRLTELPIDAFTDLPRLDVLLLQRNYLSQLTSNQFSGASGLRELDLSYNQISYIYSDAFEGLSELKTINLRFNHLQVADVIAFGSLSELQLLHIESNPWHCDCRMRQFSSWHQNHDMGDPAKCVGPPRYIGKRWDQLAPLEFACPPVFGPTGSRQRQAQIGELITLECPVNGDPKPMVRWEFRAPNSTRTAVANSSERQITSRQTVEFDVYKLSIPRLSTDDFGTYLCVAENPADKKLILFQVEQPTSSIVDPSTGGKTELALNPTDHGNFYDFENLPIEALIGLTAIIAIVVIMLVCLIVACRQRANEHKATDGYSSVGYVTTNGYHNIGGEGGDNGEAMTMLADDSFDAQHHTLTRAVASDRSAAAGTHLRVTFDDGGFPMSTETDDSGYLDSSEPSPHGIGTCAPPQHHRQTASVGVRFAGDMVDHRSLLTTAGGNAPLAELLEDRDELPLKETAL